VDSSLLGLTATAVWLFQGLRIGVGPDPVTASSVFGWAALAVAGFSMGVALPRALPSIFNRKPEVQREQEDCVNNLIRGVLVLGFTSHLVSIPEWGPTWDLVLAAGTITGGILLSGALPKAPDVAKKPSH
jgi:hypothetical protein